MKEEFKEVEIDAWIERNVRLGRTQHAFCMSAGPEAIETLLDALDETTGGVDVSKRTLTLKNRRPEGFRKLQLRHSGVPGGKKILSFQEKEGVLVFEFTEDAILDLESKLQLWKEGAEDFCIHSVGLDLPQELWLWRSRLP